VRIPGVFEVLGQGDEDEAVWSVGAHVAPRTAAIIGSP